MYPISKPLLVTALMLTVSNLFMKLHTEMDYYYDTLCVTGVVYLIFRA